MTLYALKRPDGTLDERFIFDDENKCWTSAWRHGTQSTDAMKSMGYSVVPVRIVEDVPVDEVAELVRCMQALCERSGRHTVKYKEGYWEGWLAAKRGERDERGVK